jgi:hypothetical protein
MPEITHRIASHRIAYVLTLSYASHHTRAHCLVCIASHACSLSRLHRITHVLTLSYTSHHTRAHTHTLSLFLSQHTRKATYVFSRQSLTSRIASHHTRAHPLVRRLSGPLSTGQRCSPDLSRPRSDLKLDNHRDDPLCEGPVVSVLDRTARSQLLQFRNRTERNKDCDFDAVRVLLRVPACCARFESTLLPKLCNHNGVKRWGGRRASLLRRAVVGHHCASVDTTHSQSSNRGTTTRP